MVPQQIGSHQIMASNSINEDVYIIDIIITNIVNVSLVYQFLIKAAYQYLQTDHNKLRAQINNGAVEVLMYQCRLL